MTHILTISPDWDEVKGEYYGEILGFPELGQIAGGLTRDDFEKLVSERLAQFNPPRRDFVIEWPEQKHEFHLAA